MLRNVLLMATSGLVLFSKEFVNAVSQPRLIGSLITAMIEFSTKTTGIPVSYIELTNIAVTVVMNDSCKVFCALFHDKLDGSRFGKLIAMEILSAFVEEYSNDLGNIGHNLRDFHGFHYRISEVIRDSAHQILSELQQYRGIQKAILVTDDATIQTTVEVDQLGVLANLQSLLNLSTDMMAFVGDNINSVTLESSRTSKVIVRRVENATLVVMYKMNSNLVKCQAAIDEAVYMLRRVCLLISNLHQTSR